MTFNFLSDDFIELNSVKNPFSCGKVNHSARLDVKNFFHDLLNYLDRKGILIKEKFDYSLLNTDSSIYKDFQFKNIVFAEGMGVKDNPFF
jgi:hypothetical protein